MATAAVSSSAKSVTIDRSKHLNQEPNKGHNRWHPDVTPVIEVEPGEQVSLETRDALDGYLNAASTVADLAGSREVRLRDVGAALALRVEAQTLGTRAA